MSLFPGAFAQHSNGYFFIAPGGVSTGGGTSTTLHLGAGAEGLPGKGFGIGAEIGALGLTQAWGDIVAGTFSPNGYFHFARYRRSKVDPFVTSGYTLLFRNGHTNLFNFGGGVNYCLRSNLGLRMVFRDHVQHRNFSNVNWWAFGSAWRCIEDPGAWDNGSNSSGP